MNFVKFTENNDWEGETWYFWLQLDGNEAELKKLDQLLSTFESGSEIAYELDMEPVTEAEVDTLVKHSGGGYMNDHNKITGTFTCPEINQGSWKDEIPDSAFEWLDDQFYKGQIKESFK